MHVDPARSRAVVTAARVAESLERTVSVPHEEADRRLRTLPGIGVWTSAEVRARAHGDPDAVSFGDYHVAKDIGWALAGRPSTTWSWRRSSSPGAGTGDACRPWSGSPACTGPGAAPDVAARATSRRASPGGTRPVSQGGSAQSSGRRGASTNSVNLRCRSRASHSPRVSSRQLDSSTAKISSRALARPRR